MDFLNRKYIEYMIEIEKKAEEILVDKNDKVKLDACRNWNRESIRALAKLKPSQKVWMLCSSNFVKLPHEKAKVWLQKDLIEANIEYNTLHSDLKVKMNELNDLEFKECPKGFSLNSLSPKEMSAMKQIWGEFCKE